MSAIDFDEKLKRYRKFVNTNKKKQEKVKEE